MSEWQWWRAAYERCCAALGCEPVADGAEGYQRWYSPLAAARAAKTGKWGARP